MRSTALTRLWAVITNHVFWVGYWTACFIVELTRRRILPALFCIAMSALMLWFHERQLDRYLENLKKGVPK